MTTPFAACPLMSFKYAPQKFSELDKKFMVPNTAFTVITFDGMEMYESEFVALRQPPR